MFPALADRRNEKAGNLSGGQQKVLEIGRALMMTPRMMLLDEPSLGLAPRTAQMVFATIKRLRDEAGMTILVVEQIARIALKYAHRGYVLVTGNIALEGSAADLARNDAIKKAYLGE